MNIFLALATSPNYRMPDSKPNGVDDYIRLSEKACLVLGRGIAPTTAEVAEALNLGQSTKTTCVVVKVSTYFGYEDQSIWEKLETWRQRSPT